jgi:regulator of replication initiation timing
LETVDEKVRMIERIKILEEQSSQMQKDLETLIFRIEELEVENSQLKTRVVQDKAKTEEMNTSFSHRMEQELKRLAREQEYEVIR